MRTRVLLLSTAIAFFAGIAATLLFVHRASVPVAGTAAEKTALYWYDPMVPAQHFDHPGKSPFMDMQLVPKYAGGSDDSAGVVHIDARQVQNLGVRTAHVERGALASHLFATGTIAFDERAVTVLQARVAGIVERLEVRAPLTAVKRGQPLLTLLAPDWTAAQEEYLALRRAKTQGLEALRSAARRRLQLLGMDEGQIRAVERNGTAQTRVVIVAPQDGVVGDLTAREGATVVVGSPLLRLNGLDTVWVNAAIPEVRAGRAVAGTDITIELPAFPGERFSGRIEALLPDLDPMTRTQTARIVLANPGHRLAPGMFARVEITGAGAAGAQVLIPTEAVIATGTRHVVIVDEGEGRFRAQEVRVGEEAGDKTAILEGLADDATVVLSGQFLIDSEASLTGTLARLSGDDASAMSHTPLNPAQAPASAVKKDGHGDTP